ncbi:MAG: hypothetical protein RLZZ28_1964 [Bacteroidota bacterium]|jgi:predicted CXXCH cytochrome family protein
MNMRIIVSLLLISALAVIVLEFCQSPDKTAAKESANAYVGNLSCQSCHKTEHTQWAASQHHKAMMPATDSSVKGNFNNVSFSADGVQSRFFKKDGKFFINTEGEDGLNHDYEVKYSFGIEPLQQYLVEFPGGRMQATRASWDTRAKKWFHQYPNQKLAPHDWLHWTGNGQNWNTMCASCHSTNLNKGYDLNKDSYQTSYNEINVSCESCHGPGKNHISYINGSAYKAGEKTLGSLLRLYKNEGQIAQVNTCAYCHARRVDITGAVLPGKEMLDDFIPEAPTTEFFYADGQVREEDYNYTSFAESKMFSRGVQCSNCHNPHTGKLKMDGAIVCGQCHNTDKYAAAGHTMHKASTLEVNCIACHMPAKVYMGNDLRHDHSFRIPRPDQTVKYTTPNTCNTCHANKGAQWAADKIAANFGKNRKHHFSDDLIPGSLLNRESEGHLNKLLADTATPAIIKAATIQYISRLGSATARNTLLNQLNDKNAQVRYEALRGLSVYDASVWLNAAAPLLTDAVRAVRIAAADLYITIAPAQIPAGIYDAYANAKAELDKFVLYQTDFAQGNVQAGEYYRKQNEINSAQKFYYRAIAKDSLLTIARINLATVLNAGGNNNEALKQLKIAAEIEPGSDHIFYSLGLLYAELRDYPNAATALKKSIALNKNNTRARYNYGLLLQQNKKTREAETVFTQALLLEPDNGAVLNALTILYMQTAQIDKALVTGKKLQQYHGNNPAYAELLKQLRLQ